MFTKNEMKPHNCKFLCSCAFACINTGLYRSWRFSQDPLPQSFALKSIHFFDKPIFSVITVAWFFFCKMVWSRAYLVFDKSKLVIIGFDETCFI